TEGKKQAGISFLLIDMKAEGVEVKPMLTLGETPAFCDTFFTDVKVPKENLLGPLNGGWNLAKALLGHERTMVGAVGIVERGLRLAHRIAAEQVGADGRPLREDPLTRTRLAQLEMRLRAHRMANYRTLAQQAKGHHPGPESSILKLVGSVLTQHADELSMDLMGQDHLSWLNDGSAVPDFERWVPSNYCYNRATTIYAGSNEIQKNIIAKLILGLPKK
ncbi:MAG: acyl-CoA dehydrogenase family protein, partial [Myxococcota bacterium]